MFYYIICSIEQYCVCSTTDTVFQWWICRSVYYELLQICRCKYYELYPNLTKWARNYIIIVSTIITLSISSLSVVEFSQHNMPLVIKSSANWKTLSLWIECVFCVCMKSVRWCKTNELSRDMTVWNRIACRVDSVQYIVHRGIIPLAAECDRLNSDYLLHSIM